MHKKMLVLIVMFGLCCGTALAQEKKPGNSMAEWLKGLQQKIAKITPKKTLPQSTMVAGVRGAKEESQTKLYWKGKKGEEQITEEELSEFREGVDFAAKGERARAVHELEEFMKLYPDSALIPDAKKTLDLVKAELKEEQKTEKVEEKKIEKKEDKKEEPKQEPKEVKKP